MRTCWLNWTFHRTIHRTIHRTMRRTTALALTAILLGGPLMAFAGDPKLEAAIEDARRQLDAAARRLAELHMEGYADASDRPMLGILLGDEPDKNGVHLVGVTPGGGAQAAGLAAGDRLVSINGVRLDAGNPPGMKALTGVLDGIESGESVVVEYARGGELRRAEVITQERKAFMTRILDEKMDGFGLDLTGADPQVLMSDTGPRLVDVDADLGAYFGVEKGVLVLRAPERGELASGDILLKLEGKPVDSAGDALMLIAHADGAIPAVVRRANRELEVRVDGKSFPGVAGVRVIHVERQPSGRDSAPDEQDGADD